MKEDGRLHLSVIKKVLELMTAAFTLVAALAWNDAIQSLFQRTFGVQSGLIAKFFYALIVTIIVVGIVIRLSRITKALEKKDGAQKE